MNKLVVAVAGLAALIGTPALAADLPMAAPVDKAAPPVPFSWSGFYIGVNAGYGWASSDWNLSDTSPPIGLTGTANPRSKGFLGGIQGGANHQFGNWVAGIEADLSLIDADATSTDPLGGVGPGVSATAHSQIDWLATFTGRFGYAFDRSLLYLKGGVAGAEFKDQYPINIPGGASDDQGTQSNTRVGWIVGAGLEYAILNNWTAKIEYDYLDFGSKDETFLLSGGPTIPFKQSIERKLQLVKFGVNYKFQ